MENPHLMDDLGGKPTILGNPHTVGRNPASHLIHFVYPSFLKFGFLKTSPKSLVIPEVTISTSTNPTPLWVHFSWKNIPNWSAEQIPLLHHWHRAPDPPQAVEWCWTVREVPTHFSTGPAWSFGVIFFEKGSSLQKIVILLGRQSVVLALVGRCFRIKMCTSSRKCPTKKLLPTNFQGF